MRSLSIRRVAPLVVLVASVQCDCSDIGDPSIRELDLPIAMIGPTCVLVDCCQAHVVDGDCLEQALDEREAWAARARELDLQYEEACALQLYYEGPYECDGLAQHDHYWACDAVCAIYHGSAALGEPCELVGPHMSTCAKDLACGPDERCHAPCEVPELALAGQRCGSALGLLDVRCDVGLACDAEGRCVSAAALGQACAAEQPCDVDGYCGPSGVCEAKVADGHACESHVQCLSSLCAQNECVAPSVPYCVDPVL